MSEVIMGNSGFKYTESTGTKSGYTFVNSRTCIIKEVATDKELFRVSGRMGDWERGSNRRASDSVGTKKFLGMDNRYYYIHVTYTKADWGQIQSSGAVLREDRTILTTLNFFPMNIETPTVPVVKTIVPVKPNVPVTSISATLPIISTTTRIPDTPPIIKNKSIIEDSKENILNGMEIEWLKRTIKTIQKQITLLIQKIMNLLQSLKT